MPAPTLDVRLAQRFRPPERPVMYHSWRDLLFLHWRFDPDVVQAALPEGLTVDTFDGHAWIGVVPFFMRNIRLDGWPEIPGAANFQELNLRTYVYDRRGRPGVWFFSLDADSWLTVQVARRWYRLPYRAARMSFTREARTELVDFTCRRRGARADLACRFRYAPQGARRAAEPGSLEFFLVERYFLFANLGQGRIASGQVYHAPYDVCDADVSVWDDNLLTLGGFAATGRPPDHALLSRGVDVDVYRLKPVEATITPFCPLASRPTASPTGVATFADALPPG